MHAHSRVHCDLYIPCVAQVRCTTFLTIRQHKEKGCARAFVAHIDAKLRTPFFFVLADGEAPSATDLCDARYIYVCVQACSVVCSYARSCASALRVHLDGGNAAHSVQELGVRMHRLLVDHWYQYTYTTNGIPLYVYSMYNA